MIFVLGSDNRSLKIKELIEKEGRLCNEIKEAQYIICPIPFSKDGENINGTNMSCRELLSSGKNKIVFAGAIPEKTKEMFNKENLKYYDLMDLEEVAILNAIPTAEGAIQTAMELTDFTLCNANILILGYGRIGKVLAKMLYGLGANVFCEARKEKDLALIKAMGYNVIDLKDLDKYLSKFDVIFNTIPYMMLNKDRLDVIANKCCVIDLASAPGGVDFEYAKTNNINAVSALTLPSKVAPLSAALYIKETIDKIIEKVNLGG